MLAWVQITALGLPVEPEVSSSLATSPGRQTGATGGALQQVGEGDVARARIEAGHHRQAGQERRGQGVGEGLASSA
jgi:hypothetical protein